MPIHDWTRVDAEIFHDFHHEWISAIKSALNNGILPPDHYALAERIAGTFGPDVLTLEGPSEAPPDVRSESGRGLALAVIRHVSGHRVVAMIEIVSPCNKSGPMEIRAFGEKAADLLRHGNHLMVIDLFPPSQRDRHGIHKIVWDEVTDNDFVLPRDRPLTIVSHVGGSSPEAFVEPVAQGAALRDMPLFLARGVYVQVPLEATYQAAWQAVPAVWRSVLDSNPR